MSSGSAPKEQLPQSWFQKLRHSVSSPILIGVGGILIIIGFIYWVSHFPLWIHNSKDYQIYCETGQIGDTLGGIMGPPIAILGVILTFLAFYIQYQANAEQRSQFKASMEQQQDHFDKTLSDQEKTHKREQIESRFFELLRMHKDNVTEIKLASNIAGRGSFEYMFFELRDLYTRLNSRAETMQRQNKSEYMISDMELLELAYTIYFYGIGTISSKQYVKGLNGAQYEVYDFCIDMLESLQEDAGTFLSGEYEYTPLKGHVNKIGHLYRHLYQTCKYIVNQDALKPAQKIEYLKVLRAQLSNYEQIMLYFNALVWFKEQWDEFFVDYQFIHNLPLDLIDMGPDVEELYKKEIKDVWETQGVYMFEQQKFQRINKV